MPAPPMTRQDLSLQTLSTIEALPARAWNALAGDSYPFLRHEFLQALEASGAASVASGWVPRHLALWRRDELVGVMPLYHKQHSYGEYVFDWAWADAWERAGGSYYPKALTAIPFTPAPGPRMALAEDVEPSEVCRLLASHWEESELSSWHLLFADDDEVDAWRRARPALIERHGVQFQWHDDGYRDFDGFLAALTSKRRKEIRRERRLVAEQGITLRRLQGREIDRAALGHFYRCYQITYLERGQQGYLNFEFFERLLDTMPDALVLVQAMLNKRPVAAALCLQGREALFGRYWGSEVEADCLHFEVCYYQGIEHCLEHGLSLFDPGTQGEHKLARGFAPRRLRSLHHIADPGLHAAVRHFCEQERQHLSAYQAQLNERLPFKRA